MKFCVTLFTLFVCSSIFSHAQQLEISGTIRDSDGVVPAASVTVRDSRGEQHTVSTQENGMYSVPGLRPGLHDVTISREGFNTIVRSVTLNTESVVVDVTLALSAVSTSISVIDTGGKATASRLDISNLDLPVQIGVVPKELLQEQGVNDMVTALRNVSGVQAQRFYGVYEQYTIRGFNAADVMLVDGMRTEAIFNRFNTQLNNVETVEVLKGPSSVLYGGDAVGGAINIVRKKPQGLRAYDFLYKGGRFNTHQIAGGATGPLWKNWLLYRVDSSYDHSDGWRGAGADRFNASPSLTWLMSERARVTVHQSFIRDNYKGDGGVAVGYTLSPFYDSSRRFSLPNDFALIGDSQTHVLFNYILSPRWEFRNGFLMRRTSEEYFVTEGIYFSPADNTVPREALYFHHTRRPKVNQAELVGHVNFLNMKHTLLFGYDYRNFYTRTDVTAGGGFYDDLTPISVLNYRETNPPITSFPIVRQTFQTNRIHAGFWQDQIDVTSKLKINVGGRFDDFDRYRDRIFTADPATVVGVQRRHQTAYTYRAGVVFAPVINQQIYFNTSTSFSPLFDVPPNGAELKPQTGRGYEVGYRWQGWNGRVTSSLALYQIELNNLAFFTNLTTVTQAGQQKSKGFDFDLNADLTHNTRLLVNYGYTLPRFTSFYNPDDEADYTGNRPRFTQMHSLNVWTTKSWRSGFTASVGMRYLGPMFTNNENSVRLGGWTVFGGAVSYRKEFWELALNAENLLNRQRYFTGSDYSNQIYPGAPVNVFATLRFRFK
ncbi:MAG: TonB-dependent receptor [Bryobacteraceae bacterium]